MDIVHFREKIQIWISQRMTCMGTNVKLPLSSALKAMVPSPGLMCSNTHRVFQPKKLTWVSVFRVFIETYWLIGWTGGQADTMWSKGLTIYNSPITPEIPGFKGYLPGARDKGQTSLWARPNSLLYTFITYLSIALQIKSKECFIILSHQPHLWITEHLLNPTSTAVETTLQLF